MKEYFTVILMVCYIIVAPLMYLEDVDTEYPEIFLAIITAIPLIIYLINH
jgi:hypothetical protein